MKARDCIEEVKDPENNVVALIVRFPQNRKVAGFYLNNRSGKQDAWDRACRVSRSR